MLVLRLQHARVDDMIREWRKNHIAREYFYIILGNIISILLNTITTIKYEDSIYRQELSSYIFGWAAYILLSGYLFSMIFSPLFGIKYKKAYFIFFIIFAIPSIFWLYIFNEKTGLEHTIFVLSILISLPISYLMAWRINSQYWRDKESKAEPAL